MTTIDWQPMETAPKTEKGLILLTEIGPIAPCEYQEGGVISEEGFWLCWIPSYLDFCEIKRPLGWAK